MKKPTTAATRKVIDEHVDALRVAAKTAGLKLNSIHLGIADEADNSSGQCHSQQLPNGHWVIVCD